MTQFIFIPDDDADKGAALASLGMAAEPDVSAFRAMAAGGGSGSRGRKPAMRILDVFEPTGAALVETPGRRKPPSDVQGGKLHPVVSYQMAIAEPRAGRLRLLRTLGPTGGAMFTLRLRSSRDGSHIEGAAVQIRLKGSNREIVAVSDSAGRAAFGFRASSIKGAVVLVEPGFHGHWGHFDKNADLVSGAFVDVDPIDLSSAPDPLRAVLKPGNAADGKGVVVGVIDTGVGPHSDLPNATGDADTSHGHGTHVAGIIAGRSTSGQAGIAPGASIRSYRVFDDDSTGVARNYEIHKAIERAVADGCHLINLSLKRERTVDPRYDDRVVSKAIEDAASRGVLAIAAAGNDFRRFVAFPARHPDVLAVSALGAESRMPKFAYDRWTLSKDRGAPDRDLYFANFSNCGVEDTAIDVIAPGAGVVSTVPGNRYAPMSGTSMACPAAVGAIARILGRQPHLLAMPPNRQRTEAMRAAALAALTSMGFSANFEGQGMVA